jgi:uncharacterized membrane protein
MGEETYAIEKAFELSEKDRNLGALCYGGMIFNVFTVIGGFVIPAYVLLSEHKNKPPLRLNAIQALVSQGSAYLISIVLGTLVAVIAHFTCIGALGYPILGLLALALLGAHIYWAYKTYQGETFTIPFVTEFVMKQFQKE